MVIVATLITLKLMDRVWWCECGEAFLWSGDVWSNHNSQHFVDPYSFSHVLHGLIFAWVFYWIAPLRKQAFGWRLSAAVLLEAAWEVFENTPFTINRYREATMALGYAGDSIGNSLGDIACCGLGFIFATGVRWYWSLTVFVVTEIGMLITIRDNLTLNVLMLFWPVEAIKQWQTAGM